MKTIPAKIPGPKIIALVGLLTAGAALHAQSPASYWTFDQGTGTTAADASGNNHPATLTGSGATWTSSARIGAYALNLASSSYAEASGAVVNTTNSFTATAWVKLSSTSGYQTILSIDGSQVSGFFLQLNAGAGGKFVFNRLASDSSSAASTAAVASSTPTSGTWYHLAGVYNASTKTLALYVNGVLQQNVSYTTAWRATGNTAIGRGKFNAGNVDFLNGAVDDARIYASALTAAQIQSLYNYGNPAALWTFDQSSGTTATDSSGNSHPATLTGSGATWTSSSKVGSYALSLASSSYAQASGAVVNTTNSFTAAAWVKLNSTSGYQTALSIDGSQVSGFYLQLNAGAGGKFAFNRLASDSSSAASTVAVAGSAPTAGTWYHLAGVYDASAKTIALYVNGVLQQSVSYTTAWRATGNTAIGRGKFNAGNVDFLDGVIDDARVFAAALTANQIQDLYNLGSTTPDFSLSANPSSLSIQQGNGGSSTITVNKMNGFNSSVSLSISGLPSGVTAVFNPASATSTSTLTLSVSGSTATGTSGLTVTGTSGSLTRTTPVTLTVTSASGGAPYTWPAYTPNLDYSFLNDPAFGTFSPPTTVLNDCANVVGTVSSGWWCFRYGPSKNSLVTSAAWSPMLSYYNDQFSYYRDTMHWPPDLRARNGYYSAVYLYGSGLCTDSASNTETGGWQSSIYYNGVSWPMVLLSYYPVYSFDPACPYSDRQFQRDAAIHEGIHSIMASMPGCKDSCWFQEGGNTFLQGEAAAQRSGDYSSLGWLSSGSMLAPFMPIECYSGWLQDDSFGGPCAEGVNRFDGGGNQICTWRRLLGGVQYGEAFPHFMGEIVSPGSVPWIWRYCTNRVLQGIAQAPGGLGDTQTRRLITEYRSRQAMCDFGKWSAAYKKLLTDNWQTAIGPEWSPYWINCPTWYASCYVYTTNSSGTLRPETRTLPGWSGANQIPLTVSGSGTISVNFQPIGANMQCVLVYRATDGSIVYSQPVSSGTCSLTLSKAVTNNVVIAVICNTDYVYQGESSRTTKYDYRLTLGSGVTGTASVTTQWFN